MNAIPVGLENLHIYDEEEVEQVQKTLNTNANYMDKSVKWRKGEMEFEALMRMLDSQVNYVMSLMNGVLIYFPFRNENYIYQIIELIQVM